MSLQDEYRDYQAHVEHPDGWHPWRVVLGLIVWGGLAAWMAVWVWMATR
jgi:hypothetical protein